MTERVMDSIDTGYELSAERLRLWLGNYEIRFENQWAAVLFAPRRGSRGLDLLRVGGEYDDVAARVDLYAGLLGFELALTGRFAASRGKQRVRQAAADAKAVLDRMSR